jgi:hypothetical protein
MNWNRVIIVYIVLATMMSPVLFPLLLTPVDNDVWFHLSMVRDMRESADLFPLEIRWINAPQGISQWYPLLFHWLLYGLSLGGLLDLVTVAILAQLFLFPCVLIAVYLLANHIYNPRVAFISVVIVSTFFPFFSRTHNCIPEALQHILIPLAILAYLKGRSRMCGLLLTLQFLNHHLDPFLVLGFIVVHRVCSASPSRFSLPHMLIFASPGGIIQLWWLTRRAESAFNLLRTVYTVETGFWSRIFLNGIEPSLVLLLLVIYALYKRIDISYRMLLILWIISLLPILFSQLGSRFPAYFVTPASLIVAPFVVHLGRKLLTPMMMVKCIIFFITSVTSSYTFFGHTHDLTVPAISPQMRDALKWIDTHTPQDAIVLVNPYRTPYDGVRIYFFTNRRVTEVPASADFHLSLHPSPESSAWPLSVEFNGIFIYKRRGVDDR